MSYNYEINYNVQKKKSDNSKYIYRNNEIDSQTYIFELALKDKFNTIRVIRRIKKCNQGNLISSEDNIIKESIDHSLTTNTFLNKEIYLEISQNLEKQMDFNYHINIIQ